MQNTLTHQQELAIRSLETLHVMPQVVSELRDQNSKYYSERQSKAFDGVLYYLSNKPEWEKRIKELEDEYGIYVYHAVHYFADYGEILDCLFVPRLDEEFDEELFFSMLRKGIAPIYSINFEEPVFSEFGTGVYTVRIGGLSKIA